MIAEAFLRVSCNLLNKSWGCFRATNQIDVACLMEIFSRYFCYAHSLIPQYLLISFGPERYIVIWTYQKYFASLSTFFVKIFFNSWSFRVRRNFIFRFDSWLMIESSISEFESVRPRNIFINSPRDYRRCFSFSGRKYFPFQRGLGKF